MTDAQRDAAARRVAHYADPDPVPLPIELVEGDPICGNDPELWFPPKGGSTVQAKNFCHVCPLETICLDYALAYDVEGVWGGTSRKDRRKIQKARKITARYVMWNGDAA